MKKLSILILTLQKRKDYLDRLLKVLQPQITDDVELLIESDNGELSIGKKRNLLLEKSTGEYICFIDDDDLVSFDYVSKILEAIKKSPDVVGMHLLHFNDAYLAGFTYHSLKYSSWFENRDSSLGFMRYYRNPNHLNPVKREYAMRVMFPEISMGEDRVYSQNILKHLKTEEYICEPIYYYLFRRIK
jgi:glycosyltransferase involved in cell wall biosynthesis